MMVPLPTKSGWPSYLTVMIVNSLSSLLRVFQSRKMGILTLLGFASGLPYALTSDSFTAWLTKAGFDLKAIGWLGLISIPYSFKFIWSPLLDRYVPPLGRRRGWMAISQISLVFVILALAVYMPVVTAAGANKPASVITLLTGLALALAFFSATQDIAIDAYRTDVLSDRETGAGVGVFTTGYRVALLLTGFVGFNLADKFGWPIVYGLMGVVMAAGLLGTFFAPPPLRPEQPPESLAAAVIEPFRDFLQRLGWQRALFTLIFIILYKLGDAMVAKMAVPFLGGKGLGFSDGDIGTIRQGLGLVATIVGTLSGGAFLSQLGINRSLWIFGIVQAVSNIGYYLLAVFGNNYPLMVGAINVENFSGGLGTAGFLGFLMTLCNARFSATQFALLSSLMAIGRDAIAAPAAGEVAGRMQAWVTEWGLRGTSLAGFNNLGWPLFFLISLLAALPGLMLLPFFAPWNGDRQRRG
jgi:MFS transporter, PAT family, beta-lactamase induction signal transducer AmpG